MTSKRRILVVTGSRADSGILLPVMRAIDASPALELRTVVTGLHLTTGTWRDVEAAGIAIHKTVRMQRKGETGRRADVEAVARGVSGLGDAFAELSPCVVVVLGDRIEAFAAATAASVGGFRLAHIHGGDRAQGVADEAMRHAVSKLAHLHFAASTQSRRRLIRMGEAPDRVWNTGSPAIDDIADIPAASDVTLVRLGLPHNEPFVVVLQHPSGQDHDTESRMTKAVVLATKGVARLMLGPNHDAGREGVTAALDTYNIKWVEHLDRPTFISILKRAAALIGNSSAGLIEASAIRPGGLPVVNVGTRQAGRQRPGNVIDAPTPQSVLKAVMRVLTDPPRGRCPFGRGEAGIAIAKVLSRIDLNAVSVHKHNAY